MRFRPVFRLRAFALVVLGLLVALSATAAHADHLQLKDGRLLEGVIQKVENGKVAVKIGSEIQSFSILDVTSMDFDTPHLPPGAPEHLKQFLGDAEAQEVVSHLREVNRSAEELRAMMQEIQNQWGNRKSIPASERAQWMTTRGRFNQALARYQEVLDDFYFHVLNKVEDYNHITKQANQLYVGVKGVFNAGSPLVNKDEQELPLNKYVPSNWYDTIFYRGYQLGFSDAYWGNPQKRDPLE
jgi:hypothetical protein